MKVRSRPAAVGVSSVIVSWPNSSVMRMCSRSGAHCSLRCRAEQSSAVVPRSVCSPVPASRLNRSKGESRATRTDRAIPEAGRRGSGRRRGGASGLGCIACGVASAARRWDGSRRREEAHPAPAAAGASRRRRDRRSSRPMSATTATRAHASPTDRFVRSADRAAGCGDQPCRPLARRPGGAERSFEASRLPVRRPFGQPGGELCVVVLGHRIGSEAAVGEGCEPASASRIARAP